MRLIKAQIPRDCEIALHGDTHDGAVACCRDGIEALVDWTMAKRNRYIVHLGDAIEAVTVDDKRFASDANAEPKPLRQRDDVVALYRPARKRVLAWMGGNHECALANVGDIAEDIARGLGCPYGGYQCKLRLELFNGWQAAKFFLWHGPRGGKMTSNAKDYQQRAANLAASLRRRMEAKAADCHLMAMGHTHHLIVVPPCPRLLLSDDGRSVRQRYLTGAEGVAAYIEPDARWYVNTGSYLRTQVLGIDTYAEVAGYDPVELGHAVVVFEGGKLADVRREVWRG